MDGNSEENLVVLPTLPENAGVTIINISRNSCFRELMNIYTDDDIVDTELNVKFTDEMGVDGGGLTKEVFNIFFDQCESSFFLGEDCLVPYLPLNRRNEIENFVNIGRILQHMLVLTGTIPSKLSKITLMLIANPDVEVKAEILWEELLLFVNRYLRKILKKGKKNFSSLSDKEVEVVQEFYQIYKFYARPSSQNFNEQVLTIADEVLVETPRRLILKLREGVSPGKYSNFWSNCNFKVLIDMQSPTPTKVVNCLKTEQFLTNDEESILYMFTQYIHCLDNEKLRKLIFVITGSYVMPNSIKVHFNDTVGLSQRPEFSTCSNSITLPRTYANFNELRNDLNACITSEEVCKYSNY